MIAAALALATPAGWTVVAAGAALAALRILAAILVEPPVDRARPGS